MSDDTTPGAEVVPVDTNDGLDRVALPPELDRVRRSISDAADEVRELAESGDWEQILVGIAVIDTLRRDLALLRSTAGGLAADLMPEKEHLMEGVGAFERRASAKRVTDWDAILSAIQTRSIVDADTGEFVEDPRVAVDRMAKLVRAIVPLYRSTAAKQGGLVDARIDRDDVQDTEWGRPDVTFRPAK